MRGDSRACWLPAPVRVLWAFYVGGAKAEMFNNATEVVLMRHGTTTVLSMENNYQVRPRGFALVVPVPTVIKRGSGQDAAALTCSTRSDTLGAPPPFVEYWEQDPCSPYSNSNDCRARACRSVQLTGTMANRGREDERRSPERYHVHVEARFSVGEYNIEVLSAEGNRPGSMAGYTRTTIRFPPGAEPLLRPYVEQGMKWFVARVDPKKVAFKDGMATLSPLRFDYDSSELALPIRLGLANSKGTQDLIVQRPRARTTRYEVANYPNVTIPTNLTVDDAVRTRFGEFYAALFDHTIAAQPGAVVTEYSWERKARARSMPGARRSTATTSRHSAAT